MFTYTVDWALATVLIIVLAAAFLGVHRYWKGERHKYEMYISAQLAMTFKTNFEMAYFQKGFLFCNLYTIRDIHLIAQRMGYTLDQQDVIKIVRDLKADFSIEEGIDSARIGRYIHMHVKQQQS